MHDPRSILITGASSGIGEELAMLYARPGAALAITGRDSERLKYVAQELKARGASVIAEVIDVTDARAMADFITRVDDSAPLELVIANAGISERIPSLEMLGPVTRRTFDINVNGVFNTLFPIIPRLAARRLGQIAIVSSLAGFRGLPGHAAYCATKATVKAYGEALRGQLADEGIEVSVICPGYVKSRMTAKNRFPMPFLLEVKDAAMIIRNGLAKNRGRIAFPWQFYGVVWFLSTLPDFIADWITRKLPRK